MTDPKSLDPVDQIDPGTHLFTGPTRQVTDLVARLTAAGRIAQVTRPVHTGPGVVTMVVTVLPAGTPRPRTRWRPPVPVLAGLALTTWTLAWVAAAALSWTLSHLAPIAAGTLAVATCWWTIHRRHKR